MWRWAPSGGQPSLGRAGGSLQPYPLPLAETEAEPTPSLLDACTRVAAPEPPEVPHALLDALRERVVRAWARVDALRRELADAPEPHQLRTVGDLLLARLTDLERGADRARLLDFEGVPVEVKLESEAVAPGQRGGVLRARRPRRTRPHPPARADHGCRARGAPSRTRWSSAPRMGGPSQREIRAELPEREAAVGPMAPPRPYSVYRSSGGLEIRVGRGARHNDDLTFHHSGPGDIWMHASHAAGAHVVLRLARGTATRRRGTSPRPHAWPRSIRRRARRGACRSNWTRRKYVRKGRKAPPRQVLVERAKTLFVTPDPRLEERLRG